MTNKNIKAIIELFAEQHGLTTEAAEVELAQHFNKNNGNGNGKLPIMPDSSGGGIDFLTKLKEMKEQLNTQFKSGNVQPGQPGIDQMLDQFMKLKIMSMMGGDSEPKKNEPSATELLAQNNEMWERRLAQKEADQRFAEMQRSIDSLKQLITEKEKESSTSKNKPDPILEQIQKTTERLQKELESEKEKRHQDVITSKNSEINSLKTYIDNALDAIKNQPPPKDPADAFLEMMQKMETFDNTVKRRGKALGLTDAEVEKEVSSAKPVWQQALADIAGKDGLLSKYIGMKTNPSVNTSQPEIIQPEAALASIPCGSCGNLSTNGTDWCDSCRINHTNQEVSQRQAEADALARKAGEIPQDVKTIDGEQPQ